LPALSDYNRAVGGALLRFIVACAALGLCFAASTAVAAPNYVVKRAFEVPDGLIRSAVWLDKNRLLALEQREAGAAISVYDCSTRQVTPFMSEAFMSRNVCPGRCAGSLEWVVSPQRKYICFLWNSGAGRDFALVDISQSPKFKLKRITTPPKMQVQHALFSTDEHYFVLVHDAARASCPTTVLVMDLWNGEEAWRVDSHAGSFIDRVWWGAGQDAPRFFGTVKLYQGEFFDRAGLGIFDLRQHQLSFVRPSRNDLLMGDSAAWGSVNLYATSAAKASYSLQASLPGTPPLSGLPLTSKPLEVRCLSTPGLVLVSNTTDYDTYELWLVNVLDGTKSLVSDDCAGFDLAPDNRLLLQSRHDLELRIMGLDTSSY
jgi:hypothetical protein